MKTTTTLYNQFVIQGGLIRKLLHNITDQSSKEIHPSFSLDKLSNYKIHLNHSKIHLNRNEIHLNAIKLQLNN